MASGLNNSAAKADNLQALQDTADALSERLEETITEAEERDILLELESILLRYIALKPEDIIGAYFELAETLIKLNKHDEATACINQLLHEIKSHDDPTEQTLFQSCAFLRRAENFEARIIHEQVSGDATRALTAVNTCLDLLESVTDAPEEKTSLQKKALVLRARIFCQLEQYQQSLADVNRVLPLLTDDDADKILKVRIQATQNLVKSKLPPEENVNPLAAPPNGGSGGTAAPHPRPSPVGALVFHSPTAAGPRQAADATALPPQAPGSARGSAPAPAPLMQHSGVVNHDDDTTGPGLGAGFRSP